MNKKLQAHIAVLSANIIFGINYITIKLIVPSKLGAPALNVCRVARSLILFWCLYFLKPSKAGIDKKDVPRFFLCAITGIVLNQIFFCKRIIAHFCYSCISVIACNTHLNYFYCRMDFKRTAHLA